MEALKGLSVWRKWHWPAEKHRMVPKLVIALATLLVIWGIVLVTDLLLYDFAVTPITYYPLWISFALFIYWLGYQCLTHYKLIFSTNGNGTNGFLNTRNLTSGAIEQRREALIRLMKTGKPYLDPQLTLTRLSEQLDMKPKDLTVVLNQRLQTRFYDFLNKYRVQEAKEKLIDPGNAHLTIIALANESGFNSKSSFNSVFKKHVNMTPRNFQIKFSANSS